jgi:hypothetical protein
VNGYKPWQPGRRISGTPEQLDAAAQVTPEDIAAARVFWSYWGTPLLNAMLDAEPEPAAKRGRG